MTYVAKVDLHYVATAERGTLKIHTGSNMVFFTTSNIAGKDIPLQAWTGPEGSRRLRLPDFKTVGT